MAEDEDMMVNITWDQFQELTYNDTFKIKNFLLSSLKNSKINPNELYAVEIIGGLSRTPIIQQLLQEVFGKEVSKTLDQSECVSWGVALFAAMNSYSIKVNKIDIESLYPYQIDFVVNVDD